MFQFLLFWLLSHRMVRKKKDKNCREKNRGTKIEWFSYFLRWSYLKLICQEEYIFNSNSWILRQNALISKILDDYFVQVFNRNFSWYNFRHERQSNPSWSIIIKRRRRKKSGRPRKYDVENGKSYPSSFGTQFHN